MIIQVINSVFFISIEKPKTGSKDGLKVILSIQPNGTEVADLIDIILSRYGHQLYFRGMFIIKVLLV